MELFPPNDGKRQADGQKLELTLGELEYAADIILLGSPDSLRLGLRLDKDDDGNCWVHLEKLGLWPMAESHHANAG